MSEARTLNVSEIIERMKASCALKTDSELSNHLGVSNKTVSSWRSRNSLPIEAVLQLSFETSKPIDYFIWGEEINRRSSDMSFSDLRIKDFEIAGSIALVNTLKEFAEDELAFLSEREINEKGNAVGHLFISALGWIRQEREVLLDNGRMSEAEFEEYTRKAQRTDLPYFTRAIESRTSKNKKGPQ